MGSFASGTDMMSNIEAHEQLIKLSDYVSGLLNASSLEFLQTLCLKNPAGLEKLMARCQQLNIHLKAEDVNRVIQSLLKQIQLPKDIMGTIRYYLLDKRMNSIANVLNSVAEKLEDSMSSSDSLKSVLHIVNNLSLLANTTPEDQFLRSVIIMLMNFQNKDHHQANSVNSRRRTEEDASKWLRTLLALSEKSDLIKLIDLLADRLHLGGHLINGETRNMDRSELYFLFEEAAIQAGLLTIHESNKQLILNLNAIMLTMLVCKKAPTAFFDIVSSRHKEHEDCLKAMKKYYKTPLMIENFFASDQFESYFREHHSHPRINQHAFISSMAYYLQAVIAHQHEGLDAHTQLISQFLHRCYQKHQTLNSREFMQWFKQAFTEASLKNQMCLDLLNTLEREAQNNHHRMGSLVFTANKLVGLGFAPRATTTSSTGIFQPLITPRAPHTDIQNMKALKSFSSQLNPEQGKQMLAELLLVAVFHHKTATKPLEATSNQAKQSIKRIADSNYPIPTLHNLRKSKTARTTRVIRQHPSYAGTFFAEPTKTKSSFDIKRTLHKFVH